MSDKHRDSPNQASAEQNQSWHPERSDVEQGEEVPAEQFGQSPSGTQSEASGTQGEAAAAGQGGAVKSGGNSGCVGVEDAVEGEFLGAETLTKQSGSRSASDTAERVATEGDTGATSDDGAGAVGEDGRAEEAAAQQSDPAELQLRIEQLETDLQEAHKQAETYRDQALRIRAEMENMQRRAQKDVEQAKRQGLEKVAADLLQVKDSLEMGVQAAEDQEADREKLLEGSQLTLKMLNQVFERFQIEELNPQGERFNPDYHEAMAAQPSSEQEPNTVLHVVQKGYRLEERLLRPALVIVARQAEDPSGGQGGGSVDESV